MVCWEVLLSSPLGLFAILLMPVIAFLLGRGKDARWVVLSGLLALVPLVFLMKRSVAEKGVRIGAE